MHKTQQTDQQIAGVLAQRLECRKPRPTAGRIQRPRREPQTCWDDPDAAQKADGDRAKRWVDSIATYVRHQSKRRATTFELSTGEMEATKEVVSEARKAP